MKKDYLIATDVKDALSKMKDNPSYAFLAGGTEINRLDSSIQCEGVISLSKLGLDKIEKVNGEVKIGGCVTFQQLIDSPLVPDYLKKAAHFCASRTRRNMATVSGNLALGRDDSYLMPTLLASKSRLLTYGLSSEGVYSNDNIPIREYHAYHSQFSSTLLVGVLLPDEDRFVDSSRFSKTAQAHAAVTVSFGAAVNDGKFADVRIFAAVKGTGILRFSDIENGIENESYADAADVQFAVSSACNAVDDQFGSAAYKRYVTGIAVAQAYRRAKGEIK